MKGRVVFWFELNFATNTGCVMFKLYGQQCQRCKTGKFEHAMWYPEEVVKVKTDFKWCLFSVNFSEIHTGLATLYFELPSLRVISTSS